MKTSFTAVPALILVVLMTGCSSDDLSEEERVEAFCDLVALGRGLEQSPEYITLTQDMMVAIANATGDTDPEAVAAIQAWGEALYDLEGQVIPIYEGMLDVVEDPEIREGIEITIDLTRDFGLPYATQFAEATSVSEWQAIMAALQAESEEKLEDPHVLDALTALDDYAVGQCGFPLSMEND